MRWCGDIGSKFAVSEVFRLTIARRESDAIRAVAKVWPFQRSMCLTSNREKRCAKRLIGVPQNWKQGSVARIIRLSGFPMKQILWLLKWVLKAAIFFTLFAFALNNQQDATVHFFFGTQWRAPQVLVVLVAFTCGVGVGVLGMVPRWWKSRRSDKQLIDVKL